MFFFRKKIAGQELAEAIKTEAQKYFRGINGCHDWDHSLRVLNNCRLIAKDTGANMLVVELASYLHDIGRNEEVRNRGKVCHAKIGGRETRKILNRYGATKELTEAVVHCVESHRSKSDCGPRTAEAKAVYDSDKLDALGAVGLVRLFLFANEVGAGIHNKESDLNKTATYSPEDTAFREFYFNTRFLKDKMETEPGKRLARERYDFMIKYFEKLFSEVNADEKFFTMLDEIRVPEAARQQD